MAKLPGAGNGMRAAQAQLERSAGADQLAFLIAALSLGASPLETFPLEALAPVGLQYS
jgi:hypothetical protein